MNNGCKVPKKYWPHWWYSELNVVEVWTEDGTYTNYRDLHRTDGPALIYTWKCTWWVNGVGYYNINDFATAAQISEEDKIALILKYGNFL